MSGLCVVLLWLTGVMGADLTGLGLPCADRPLTSRMALVCGTSSCHMAVGVVLQAELDHSHTVLKDIHYVP